MEEKDPLVFKYEDIKAQGGLNIKLSPDIAFFADAFEKPGSLKKLDLELDFSVGGDSILLEGRVSAELELECSRCAEPLARTFADSFDEVYPDTVEYIDTREVIREAAALLAPIKVLCAESCKGRCLVCGINRNTHSCECRAGKTSSFEALKDFKPGKPGGKKKL
ncbi:MAG TPA: hypothetical protein DEQ38_10220 [Elusimicrobia bacterium]|nr:MAG: hypothetical protein A2089_01910 [Elusimicrobia bacterium GWD2_63_28]HCC48473.1 hypothetical protein [Elusimicrobiota bacterium]